MTDETAATDETAVTELPETLGKLGQIFVTAAAAERFGQLAGYDRHELETARRELTALLIDARPKRDPSTWRARKRSTMIDVTVRVVRDAFEPRMINVTQVLHTRGYDPPSTTTRRSVRRPR